MFTGQAPWLTMDPWTLLIPSSDRRLTDARYGFAAKAEAVWHQEAVLRRLRIWKENAHPENVFIPCE